MLQHKLTEHLTMYLEKKIGYYCGHGRENAKRFTKVLLGEAKRHYLMHGRFHNQSSTCVGFYTKHWDLDLNLNLN